MNIKLEVYCELNDIIDYSLEFFLNSKKLHFVCKISDHESPNSKVIYQMSGDEIYDSEKTHLFDIKFSKNSDDHAGWIEIKEIKIDDIPAEWLIYRDGFFKHSMPRTWIEEMKENNVEILDQYCPGTELRINGQFSYKFQLPMWYHKTMSTWKNYEPLDV